MRKAAAYWYWYWYWSRLCLHKIYWDYEKGNRILTFDKLTSTPSLFCGLEVKTVLTQLEEECNSPKSDRLQKLDNHIPAQIASLQQSGRLFFRLGKSPAYSKVGWSFPRHSAALGADPSPGCWGCSAWPPPSCWSSSSSATSPTAWPSLPTASTCSATSSLWLLVPGICWLLIPT